jgi:glycosyltransferase involved in cell wall biosynthesis
MEISKKQISFLITHYNRPDDLAKCLAAVRNLNLQDSEIVVCDDASHEKHLKIIQDYQIDQLVAEVNQGLAANIKGIVACQESILLSRRFYFEPKIIEILPECMGLLKEEKVDMIRFTSNSVLIN